MKRFEDAVGYLDRGEIEPLSALLAAEPELAVARDGDGATLLTRLVDWPGHRPRAGEAARLLLEAGADPEARRDPEQGTPLSGAICSLETDVVRALLDGGADPRAALGFQPGTIVDLVMEFAAHQHSWSQLEPIVTALERKLDGPVERPPRFGPAAPVFPVGELAAALEFYRDSLGFAVTYEEADYAVLERGDATLHLAATAGAPTRAALWIVPVAALHAEWQAHATALVSRAWGHDTFSVVDPAGNQLEVSGPTS